MLREKLGKELLFFDGGTGTILQEKGLKAGELPEVWNIEQRETIVQLHTDYLNAGCNIIKTNTFGANHLKFNENTTYQLEQIIVAAIENAKEAQKNCNSQKDTYIALDIGPSGKLLKPMGDLSFEDAYELFSEVVKIGVSCGVDLILIETMSDTYEAKAAILAAKENSNLPVIATMIFGENKQLLTGGNVLSTVALLEGLGVDALGLNCGLGPVQMKDILKEMLSYASIPVVVNPNAGLPRSENGKTIFDVTPEEFSASMKEFVEMGASVLGGCCGTTPNHIKMLVDTCESMAIKEVTNKEITVVSSYAKAVVIDEVPVLVGERINPTGKAKFKQALKDNDLEYVLREGLTQQERGAHILDVNVGLPGIDEVAMMEQVVPELQSILDLPLQIDTSNVEAMERALRIYNGKPLINSVNGTEEVMEAIFPLVKKYGGVVIGLALDENGIPTTASGRIEVAKKIYETAKRHGIQKKDIIIDALAMTISSDTSSAKVTLETLQRIRDELHGKSTLGVSNISFGLPQRSIINANFFTMALYSGLNVAIMNPNSEAMMQSYYSYLALMDKDDQCNNYISHYAGVKEDTIGTKSTSLSLGDSIERGLKEGAFEATKELLKTTKPLDIINQELVPALDRVGKGFEKGTVFLPQLLMSAEAAKTAFEVIKTQLATTGQVQEKKGKIILATVKGDIHDIGKNIVKVLLENYSYEVIDLGKDVAPEVIVETAIKENVLLVGLSALMTTTVVNMEETIKQLRKAKPDCKIMVGGAVLTKDYADDIGADFYGKDAMATVTYAESLNLLTSHR